MWGTSKSAECSRFLDLLEQETTANTLPPGLAAHAASCPECKTAAQELFASRALLSALPQRSDKAGPWFAPRVMAAIAAREAELRRSVEAWTMLPNLAEKFALISALALVLTSTWLVSHPAPTQSKPVVTDLTGEPVVDTAQPVNNDDVLVSLTEKLHE